MLLASVASCGSDQSDPLPTRECEPSEVEPCTCGDGSDGVRLCDEGWRLGQCACDAPEPDVPMDDTVRDRDGDGIDNAMDNCPDTPNPDQEDPNGDGIGAACDPDNDAIVGDFDNCPERYNPDQTDSDGDDVGDACDPDVDGDGVDNVDDNCPGLVSADTTDTDADGLGDVCDGDDDDDSVGDADDNCPTTPNPQQADRDDDGIGDACADPDGDGVVDADDDCPDEANPEQGFVDSDGDGLLDCEERAVGSNPTVEDTDGDGLTDEEEVNRYGTDPTNENTDGDAFDDGLEVQFGTDPLTPSTRSCDDVFEVNDACGSATPLSNTTQPNLNVCLDEDWHTVDLGPHQILTVTATYDRAAAAGDLDLALMADDCTTLLVSGVEGQAGMLRAEQLTYQASAQGATVHPRAYMFSGFHANYDLEVSVVDRPACVDDEFAPNGAVGAAAAVDAPGLAGGLQLCEGTTDWFAVDLEIGQLTEVYLNFEHAAGNLDVIVYDAAMNVVSGSTTMTDDESATFVPLATQTYFFEVFSPSDDRVRYDLLLYTDADLDGVAEGPIDRDCPDPLEQNDDRAESVPLAPGQYDLTLCAPLDPDFFQLYVPPGATIDAEITFSHAMGNLDLWIEEIAGSVVASSTSLTDDEQVSATNFGTEPAFYVLAVGANINDSFVNEYALSVSISFANACVDDALAQPAQAPSPLTAPGQYDLMLCEGTEDWFSLGDVASVEAYVEASTIGGLVALELHDATGLVAASSLALEVSGLSGAHWLRVVGQSASVRSSYDLWLATDVGSPAQPFCTDPLEQDDDPVYATFLDQEILAVPAGMACGSDEDWYRTAEVLDSMRVLTLFYDHTSSADLDVTMWDADDDPAIDPPLASVNTQADDGILPVAAGTGPFLLRVRNASPAPTNVRYDLLFGPDSMYRGICPEDAYEPNGSIAEATAVAFPTHELLGMCSPDDDVFAFARPDDGPVTVTVAFDAAELNLALRAQLRSNGTVVATADDDSGNRETLTFDAVGGLTYVVAVEMVSGDGPYFLHIE